MKITKEMYEKIMHLFPKQKSPPKISNLEVLNTLLYVLENGCKWRSIGTNWHTIYTRVNRWAKNKTLEKIFIYLQKIGVIYIDVRIYSLDSTCVKVHPDGHGAIKKGANNQSEKQKAVGTQKFIWSPHPREMQ